jgi:tetratricopeptide (TPR) repeat protein
MWGAAVNAITASNHLLKLHQNVKNGRTAVSLQWLKNFALSHVDENMSTEDVVQRVSFIVMCKARHASHSFLLQIIIPATVDFQCRYVDILDPLCVGPPSCFVSHRWGANFRELTKVLLQHFADEEDQDVNDSTSNPFIWLDIFAILQHKTNEQTSDLANLQNVIVQSHQTLLVLDDTGQVLRRVWCLFEVWKTVQHKSVSGLVVLARDVNLLGLKKIFTELNVAEAEATVEADRIKILLDIEQSIGIETMNGAIRSALVQSTMLEVVRMLPRMTEKKSIYFRCIGKASQMCALAGLYADAQPLMIEALELSRELVGEMHELTASSYNNMAGLLRYTGKFSRAEPHQRRAVEISEAVSGNGARTRIYLGNLGQLLQNLGRLTEAETYLLRALSIPQANAGDLSTPHLLNSLASLYMDLGKPSEALPLYKKALESVSRVLSPTDPEIAVYMANLAGVYVELKAFDEAEKLQRKAIEICERALGREHPTTAGCINNLAEILAQQRKLIEAHSLANEAYSIRLKLLGESHNSTANSLNNLAGILVELKRYEDAEPLMRKSLDLALNRSDSEKGRGNMEDAVSAARMVSFDLPWGEVVFAELTMSMPCSTILLECWTSMRTLPISQRLQSSIKKRWPSVRSF